jgi:hypothetical protein
MAEAQKQLLVDLLYGIFHLEAQNEFYPEQTYTRDCGLSEKEGG